MKAGILLAALGALGAVVFLRGGAVDRRAAAIQDDGAYAIGRVDKVDFSVTHPASPGATTDEAAHTASYVYNVAGRRMTGSITLGADRARTVEGKLFLVMYSNADPEVSLLDLTMPVSVVATTSGVIAGVEGHTIGGHGAFRAERSKPCYRFNYQVGGQTVEAFESLGIPTSNNIGKIYAVAYDIRAPENARLLVGQEINPSVAPPSIDALLLAP